MEKVKSVSVVEIYTTKFSYSLFLLKILEIIEIMYAMNPENHWLNNFCLMILIKVSFCFCTSVFRLIQWTSSEANRLVILEATFETCIFWVCFYFWKDKSYFNLIYFWICKPNSSVEGDEGGIFEKSSRLKPFPYFLLKIKIKQNPGCPNKEYNAIFKHIHQNIRAQWNLLHA